VTDLGTAATPPGSPGRGAYHGISYNSVMDNAKELVRTVANRREHLSYISGILERLTLTVRAAGSRAIGSVVTALCATLDVQDRLLLESSTPAPEPEAVGTTTGGTRSPTQGSILQTPTQGTTFQAAASQLSRATQASSVTATQVLGRGRPRLQSSIERSREGSTRKRQSRSSGMAPSAGPSGDRANLEAPKQPKKCSCSFCGKEGHRLGSKCPKYNRYGTPLRKGDRIGRSKLAIELQVARSYATGPIPPGSGDIIRAGNQKGMKGILLQRRLYLDSTIQDPDTPANFCFECTFLGSTGDEVDAYTNRICTFVAGLPSLETGSIVQVLHSRPPQ
jgi:hypothetical protein